jgi:protein-disulfide isomerase/uncharacterized membrane protein
MENITCEMNRPMAINPLPFPIYLWTVVCLTVFGLADAIYLSISHYRVYRDIGYKSFCAISRALNCDTVSQSSYSIFLNLPVAVWGGIGYAFLLPFLIFAASEEAGKNRIWSLICWISLAFSCYSVFLALISTFVIKSYCIMCIVSYGINLALLFYAWIIRRRFSSSGFIEDTWKDILYLWQDRVKSIPVFSVFFVTVVCIALLFPAYWKIQPLPHSEEIPTGITASGYPWIGAENAVLEITEFADYQCFQCKKMHFFLRQLIAANPGKIKIIHRHYPMDHEFNPIVREPFHVGSGKLALLAVYAASKNRFWEMNDLLYSVAGQKKPISTKELAKTLSLDSTDLARALNDRNIRLRVKHDIYSGNKRGIIGTPAYVIDGEVYQGQIPPELIKRVLE